MKFIYKKPIKKKANLKAKLIKSLKNLKLHRKQKKNTKTN